MSPAVPPPWRHGLRRGELAVSAMRTGTARFEPIIATRGEVVAAYSLFRQDAVEFQQHHRQWGEVALLQSVSTKVMAWFVILAVTLLLAFLFFGQYARKETVLGYLTPSSGTS